MLAPPNQVMNRNQADAAPEIDDAPPPKQVRMTLAELTDLHHASLVAECWRELGTLDVSAPQISSVYGVEDFEHPRNRVGMLEVSCTSGGRQVALSGERMLPLVHGYHHSGPNSALDNDGISRGRSRGAPKLSLIRLAPPSLDSRLLKVLLRQPRAIGSIVGMAAFSALVAADVLTGRLRTFMRGLLAVWWAGHAAEGLSALYVCLVELKLSWRAACGWTGMVTVIGMACTRWLLMLRPPVKAN